MATCTVSGTVIDPSGSSISGTEVLFSVQTPSLSSDPAQGSTTTDSGGNWGMPLLQGTSGVFTISVVSGALGRKVPYKFSVNIPATSTASFSSILADT